jgi:thiamine biosynthesis lipoprotein
MGSAFTLGVVADSEQQGTDLLQIGIKEIQRIEALFSEFLPASVLSLINQKGFEQPVVLSEECFALLQRCMHISELTEGDFDITTKPLKALYQFKNQEFVMPSQASIKTALQAVGFQKILLSATNQTIQFTHPQMCISVAAIGKGYASDKVKQVWQRLGVQSGFVNASGDLSTFGKNTDGSVWKVAIANPQNPAEALMYVPLENSAVATSGDYEQHFIWQGRRYSHNLNPHDGLPITGIKSVSVFSPSAELSDALATAVYVKGVQKGIHFVNQLPQTHSIIIDENDQVYFSQKIKYEKVPF